MHQLLDLCTEGYRHGPISTMPHAAAFRDFAALPKLVESPSPRYQTPAPASPS